MSSILLINDNKIVSRLLYLSAQKQNYALEETTSLQTVGDSYDAIFEDSDRYNPQLLEQIVSKFTYNQLIYIGNKNDKIPEGFDKALDKPFLPTDFVELMKEVALPKPKAAAALDDVLLEEEEDELLGLDDESDLLLEDEDEDENMGLDTIDDDISELLVHEEEEEEDDADLSLDPSHVMSTGIGLSLMQQENDHEALAEIVNEIDEMHGESEEPQSLEPEEDIDDEPMGLEDLASGATVAVSGVLAAASVASHDALDDLEMLSERDVKDALGYRVGDVVEEIVSEETFAEGEEKLVESNDVEQWIKNAVAKAITPSMIKEALDGMEITVTLSFKEKNSKSTAS